MADLTPDQTQGPTWGSLSIPSAMSQWNPGVSVIGELATDTAFNAKRAQNLAAFEAFQKQNPGATAADLTAAAERLSLGENFFGSNAVPDIMKEISAKNQLAYQADQSKQQIDVNTGFSDALNRATDTATDEGQWVSTAKSLLPKSLQDPFTQYMTTQNTKDAFKVYQQRRVSPVVKDGIEYMWDKVDQYTTALGGNKALGQMAYDLAKPQIEANKKLALEKSGLISAQTGEALAGQTERYAAAQTERVHAQVYSQEVLDAQNKASQDRQNFLTKQLDEPFVTDAIGRGDPDSLAAATKIIRDNYNQAYPGHPEELDNFVGSADKIIAGRAAARNTALAMQRGKDYFDSVVTTGTELVRSQVSHPDSNLSYNGIDKATIDQGGGSDEEKKAQYNRAVSLTNGLLANKNMALSDPDTFKRLVAEGVRDGKSDKEIVNTLMGTKGNDGLSVYGSGAALLNGATTMQGGYYSATSLSETKRAVDKVVQDTNASLDKVMAGITQRSVNGKPQTGTMSIATLPADIQLAQQQVQKAENQIYSTIEAIRNPATTSDFYGKSNNPAVIAELTAKAREIHDKAQQLALMVEARDDLKPRNAASANLNINGVNYTLNPDISLIPPDAMGKVSDLVDQAMKDRPVVQVKGGSTMSTQPGLDQTFLHYLGGDINLQRLTAATVAEATRLRAAVTAPAEQGATIQTDKGDMLASPTELSAQDITNIVEKMVGANKEMLGTGVKRTVQNLKNLLAMLQAQGKLGGPPSGQ